MLTIKAFFVLQFIGMGFTQGPWANNPAVTKWGGQSSYYTGPQDTLAPRRMADPDQYVQWLGAAPFNYGAYIHYRPGYEYFRRGRSLSSAENLDRRRRFLSRSDGAMSSVDIDGQTSSRRRRR